MLALDGTGGFRIFEASPSGEKPIAWSPDGKALDYIVNASGVGNLWRQPVGGGPPAQLTRFESEELYTFSWSRDGRLACVRGATTHGVVLIENFR
jgi:Tol biopolymer transport system component